jgi:hypothetical protein
MDDYEHSTVQRLRGRRTATPVPHDIQRKAVWRLSRAFWAKAHTWLSLDRQLDDESVLSRAPGDTVTNLRPSGAPVAVDGAEGRDGPDE